MRSCRETMRQKSRKFCLTNAPAAAGVWNISTSTKWRIWNLKLGLAMLKSFNSICTPMITPMWQPRHCWQPTFRVTFDNDRQHDETNEDTARQKWMKQRWVWCWRSWNWETLGDEDTKGSTHHLAPRLKITPFYIPIFHQHVDDGEISLMIAISRCWQRWCWEEEEEEEEEDTR